MFIGNRALCKSRSTQEETLFVISWVWPRLPISNRKRSIMVDAEELLARLRTPLATFGHRSSFQWLKTTETY